MDQVSKNQSWAEKTCSQLTFHQRPGKPHSPAPSSRPPARKHPSRSPTTAKVDSTSPTNPTTWDPTRSTSNTVTPTFPEALSSLTFSDPQTPEKLKLTDPVWSLPRLLLLLNSLSRPRMLDQEISV